MPSNSCAQQVVESDQFADSLVCLSGAREVTTKQPRSQPFSPLTSAVVLSVVHGQLYSRCFAGLGQSHA